MLNRITAMAALAAVVFTAACDDDDDGLGPEDFASVRVVNASPSTQNLDLFSGNNSLVSNIAFGSGSAECVDIEDGAQMLELRAAGSASAIATLNTNLVANTNYTLVLFGDNTAQLLTDQFTAPGTDLAQIRFVNAASGVAAIDVHATAPGSDAFGATPTAANIAVSGTSQFIEIPVGNNRIRFTEAGTTNVLLDISTLTIPTNRVATVVLTKNEADQFAFVLVEPCS